MNKINNHKLTKDEQFEYYLYIGPHKDSLESACSSFNYSYNTNTTNYERKAYIRDNDKILFKVDAHTDKKFKYDDYISMMKSLRMTIRSLYPHFYEHLSGTIFIDYLYVAIVKIDSLKDKVFPFIINGPYLNINISKTTCGKTKTTCELQHYIQCLPLVWFPFIPNTSIKLKDIKSEYLQMYWNLFRKRTDEYKLSDLTLLEISLEDDFHVPRIGAVYDNNGLDRFYDNYKKIYRSSPLPTIFKEKIINKEYTFATINDGKEYLESSIALWKKDT